MTKLVSFVVVGLLLLNSCNKVFHNSSYSYDLVTKSVFAPEGVRKYISYKDFSFVGLMTNKQSNSVEVSQLKMFFEIK